jgi:hypothetical protein
LSRFRTSSFVNLPEQNANQHNAADYQRNELFFKHNVRGNVEVPWIENMANIFQ